MEMTKGQGNGELLLSVCSFFLDDEKALSTDRSDDCSNNVNVLNATELYTYEQLK